MVEWICNEYKEKVFYCVIFYITFHNVQSRFTVTGFAIQLCFFFLLSPRFFLLDHTAQPFLVPEGRICNLFIGWFSVERVAEGYRNQTYRNSLTNCLSSKFMKHI